MDTLTHIVLGACIGEVIAGKQLGKKALLLGAIGQSIPDIDFLNSFWLPTCADMVAHRGITHSILFAVLCSSLLAWVSMLAWKRTAMVYKQWLLLWGIEVFVHIFIDAFNAYGTGWFEPFSHFRVSFNSIYVADPLFSMWPLIASVVLLFLKKDNPKRRRWAARALIISVCYLLISICIKLSINHKVNNDLSHSSRKVNRYFTTPTIFNNMLWYIVAESDSGYYTGYRSVFDKQGATTFRFVYRNDSLLNLPCSERDKELLLRFADGYYTSELWHDTLVFNILRFGETAGWMEPNPRFACYYYLQHPDDNKLIVQRGRFAGWNKDVFIGFLKRIGGNTP